MFLRLRAETQFVDFIDDLAHIVTALDFVLYLAEDLSNLVFDGIRPGSLLLESVEVWKELQVNEIAEIIAGHGGVMIKLAVLPFGRGPFRPPIRPVENIGVFLAIEL